MKIQSEWGTGLGRAREKSTKINFLGAETAWWGGGLPRERVVAEKFVLSLESLSSLGFEERNLGCPGNFAGMSRTPGGVQEVCAKKICAHFLFPSKSGKGGHQNAENAEIAADCFFNVTGFVQGKITYAPPPRGVEI